MNEIELGGELYKVGDDVAIEFKDNIGIYTIRRIGKYTMYFTYKYFAYRYVDTEGRLPLFLYNSKYKVKRLINTKKNNPIVDRRDLGSIDMYISDIEK